MIVEVVETTKTNVKLFAVSQSMRNIKDIKNTLSSIETASRRNDEKFNKWNETMSVLMQDLKAKIAKARHIADGVS